MIPYTRQEVRKQSLILEFHEAFDIDEFGKYIYDRLNIHGLSGGKIVSKDLTRDFELTLFYEVNGKVEKEVLKMNVFGFFGKSRLLDHLQRHLYDYFYTVKDFREDYKEVFYQYRKHLKDKQIKSYVNSNDLLLQPW